MIYASQNLFGVLAIDNWGLSRLIHTDTLSNGIAMKDGLIYLGDWSDILKIDPLTGKVVGRIMSSGRYDNIHTINFYGDKLLITSTGNDRIYLDDEIIFSPKDYGYKQFIYLNSAVHWHDSIIIISARLPKHVILFDVDTKKVIKTFDLSRRIHNQHHPIPFNDMFAVSDGDGILLFNEQKPVQKSPPLAWPRGIKQYDEDNIIGVDRKGVFMYNVPKNAITHRYDSPIEEPNSTMHPESKVIGTALFDLVFTSGNSTI